MSRLAIKSAVFIVASAACAAVHANESPRPAGAAASAVSVEQGRRAYTSFCTRCHGINLVSTSSAYFDLRTFPKDEKERFVDAVVNGKRQMPAWKGIVKPEAVESLWLYMGSVNGW